MRDSIVVTADYVVVRNLQVENAKGIGISIYGTGCVVQGCVVLKSYLAGIEVHKRTQVRDNRVAYNSQINKNRDMDGGWPAAIKLYRADESVVTGNRVYENFGEGINLILTRNAYVGYNPEVRDNYNVNIYLDNSNGNVVEHNTCTSNWISSYFSRGTPAAGI